MIARRERRRPTTVTGFGPFSVNARFGTTTPTPDTNNTMMRVCAR
jgi:hypothetical protein